MTTLVIVVEGNNAMSRYVATVTFDRLLELPQAARESLTPRQVIEIDLTETMRGSPNKKVLARLRDLAELKKHMPESVPSDTNRIIREGRSGAMYAV